MEKRKINLIEAAMKYKQVTIVVTVILLIVGVIALLNMPRSEDPHITVRQGLVIALYPGADEVQMEKQVTNKIEQYLFSFEEVRKEKTKSETKDGQTVITCELNENVKDTKRTWNMIQRGLSMQLRSSLPAGVVGPFVNSDFGDVVAQMITVSAPGRSYAELEKYLDKLEDGIKTIQNTSKIKRYGGQRQQIYIKIDDKKLRQYGFDVATIARVLQMQNVTSYAGELNFQAGNIPLFANSQYRTEAEIGNQIVYTAPDGKVVRLKDVAAIERRYEQTSSYIKVGDRKVMMLTVEMQPGNNIVQFGEEVQRKIDEVKQTLPPEVAVNTIVNQPEVVHESVSHFMVEFGIAIASVIIVVIILLPFRVAAISALACPISIVITFAILNMMGIEIHQVSLAAMIIVLGMVVDNAIVVVDNYIEKLDEGLDRWTAGWESATQLMLPIFTATAAIIFAFLPLAFLLSGLPKEFIQTLPVAVAVALTVSFVVAVLLTPYMCYVFIRKGLKHHHVSNQPVKKSMLDRLQNVFNTTAELCFRYPKTVLLVGLGSVVLAIVAGGKVEEEFFPNAERNQFNIELWLPNGTGIAETEKAVQKVEDVIKQDKRVVNLASFIGASSPRFHVSYAPETSRENYAQIFINTVSNKATEEMAQEYLEKFNNFLPNGYVRIRQVSLKDPPAPIEVRIIGEDLNNQKQVAEQVEAILDKTRGVNWVRTDYQDDYFGVKATLKQDAANRLGVTNATITQALGAGLKGYAVTTLWEGDKPVDILLRLDVKNRSDFNELGDIYVSTAYGSKVPLREVAALQPAWHTGIIAHRNGLRTLTVRGEAQLGRKASKIQAEIEPEIAKLQLPEGIRIAYGGEKESTLESQPNMMKSLGVSLVLIFLTLLFQFKSFGKVMIVLATFPLSLLGAMLGLLLTGNPMGFTAFMGIISLVGIVVRNGIILVDYADELVNKHGYTIKAAALATAKRRMRPIFLTSCAAAIGVVPMIAGKSPLWAPLGSVLAVGLIVSMIMTLYVVPVLYFVFVKPEPQAAEEEHPRTGPAGIMYKPSLPVIVMIVAAALGLCAAPAKAQQVLTLENCRQLALERNNNLRIAQQQIAAAKAAKAAADVNSRPGLDAGINGFYIGEPLNNLLPEYGVGGTLSITQPVYMGGKLRLAKAAAQKGVEMNETQKVLTASEVLLNVEKAYWQTVSAKEKIVLAQQLQKQLQALHTELKNSYDAGVIYKNDVLRTEVQLNSNELDLTKAQDALVVAKLNLAQMIGAPDSIGFNVTDSVIGTFTSVAADTAVAQAIAMRPEIRILQQQIALDKIQEQSLKAEMLPAISLSAGGLGAAGKQGINPTSNSNVLGSYYGLASINIPIFHWGAKKQQVKQQSHKLAARQLQLENTRQLVAIEIQDAYLQLNQSAKRVSLSGLSLEQASENLKLSNDRFAAGTITGKDVLEAQTIWQQAYSNTIDAKTAYKVNEAAFKKAIGMLQ